MSQVHRFHDKVAVVLGSGKIIYLTAKEAGEFTKAIGKVKRSIEKESYQNSSGLTWSKMFSGEK